MSMLLNPPFRIDWQINPNDVTENILQLLETVAAPIRPQSNSRRRQRNRGRRKENDEKDGEIPTSIRNENVEQPSRELVESEVAGHSSEEACSSSGDRQDSKIKMFKDHMVIGISKILRLLEQRALAVVLFDRSFLRPSAIAQFIGSACIASGAHCATVDGLSSRLAIILNIKSASVIAIRKSDNGYPASIETLVNAVTTLSKPVVLVSASGEGDGGGQRKKKRKRISPTDAKTEHMPYVEASVLVQQRVKKKRK